MAGWLVLCKPWLLDHRVIPWDSKDQFYPFARFISESIRSGQLPFWNPYVYAGYPMVSDPQSLMFSPLAAGMMLILLACRAGRRADRPRRAGSPPLSPSERRHFRPEHRAGAGDGIPGRSPARRTDKSSARCFVDRGSCWPHSCRVGVLLRLACLCRWAAAEDPAKQLQVPRRARQTQRTPYCLQVRTFFLACNTREILAGSLELA